jgi:hypothetical protein
MAKQLIPAPNGGHNDPVEQGFVSSLAHPGGADLDQALPDGRKLATGERIGARDCGAYTMEASAI